MTFNINFCLIWWFRFHLSEWNEKSLECLSFLDIIETWLMIPKVSITYFRFPFNPSGWGLKFRFVVFVEDAKWEIAVTIGKKSVEIRRIRHSNQTVWYLSWIECDSSRFNLFCLEDIRQRAGGGETLGDWHKLRFAGRKSFAGKHKLQTLCHVLNQCSIN